MLRDNDIRYRTILWNPNNQLVFPWESVGCVIVKKTVRSFRNLSGYWHERTTPLERTKLGDDHAPYLLPSWFLS